MNGQCCYMIHDFDERYIVKSEIAAANAILGVQLRRGENMRRILSLALTLLMAMEWAPTAFAADAVAAQIAAMPAGTKIELRLKNKEKLSGTTGAISSSGFTLVDAHTGEHQFTFDDVASVKRLGSRSHTRRNVLIVTGIAVVAVGIGLGIYAKKCAPFGCNSRPVF
jgi:hypothetical protein